VPTRRTWWKDRIATLYGTIKEERRSDEWQYFINSRVREEERQEKKVREGTNGVVRNHSFVPAARAKACGGDLLDSEGNSRGI